VLVGLIIYYSFFKWCTLPFKSLGSVLLFSEDAKINHKWQ